MPSDPAWIRISRVQTIGYKRSVKEEEMSEITAAMVMQLRERMQGGMMRCKEALVETEGDFEAAVNYIRTVYGNSAPRGDRVASEGVIAIAMVDRQDAAIIELNAETGDGVRCEVFQELAKELAEQVARRKGPNVETVLNQNSLAQPGMTVQARLEDVYTNLRERIVFKRFDVLSTDRNGVL